MTKFHSLRIKKITKETTDAVSITFDIPTDLKEDFKFTAGQYITIKTTIQGKEVRRAYSICSSPNSDEVTVAVKRIEGGFFSVYATTELSEDMLVEVALPEGKFVLNTAEHQAKNYLAFAVGSGITPIMSMIKSVLETAPKSTFTLVFGNKTKASTLFYNALNTLQNTFVNFHIHYVFSQEKVENAQFGRIDKSTVLQVLERNTFDDVFLCGPEKMITTVKQILVEQNILDEHIHFELFTSKHKKNDEVISHGNEHSEITILLDDETTTFSMKKDSNILKAALEHNLDAPYSCQGGICSSCLAKVTEGEAKMNRNTVLSKEELAEGYILTCEAHPTTDKIVIDYDI